MKVRSGAQPRRKAGREAWKAARECAGHIFKLEYEGTRKSGHDAITVEFNGEKARFPIAVSAAHDPKQSAWLVRRQLTRWAKERGVELR